MNDTGYFLPAYYYDSDKLTRVLSFPFSTYSEAEQFCELVANSPRFKTPRAIFCIVHQSFE